MVPPDPLIARPAQGSTPRSHADAAASSIGTRLQANPPVIAGGRGDSTSLLARVTTRVVETQSAPVAQVPTVTSTSTADGFQFTVSCPTEPVSNLRCLLEGSQDLVTWTKVMVRANENGTMSLASAWKSTEPLSSEVVSLKGWGIHGNAGRTA
jgi:hypothetical protein